uniref:Uncharacterized protein n=1 Tax=Romanomermis culicivorax TaxID=13658 RepID=A0A915KPK1_ROMCU
MPASYFVVGNRWKVCGCHSDPVSDPCCGSSQNDD